MKIKDNEAPVGDTKSPSLKPSSAGLRGGEAAGEALAGVFDPAHDHAPSAQGNIAGGNSPLWHGSSGDSAGHRNGAAQWGMRSKEFGGAGYNQQLLDDPDASSFSSSKAARRPANCRLAT